MRVLSGILFWLGLVSGILVAALALAGNGIAELIVGLMFAAKRDFLAVAGPCSVLLIGLSMMIRRKMGSDVPRWRRGVLGAAVLGSVYLAIAALNPGFSTDDVAYSSQGAEMRATLYLPDRPEPLPGLVVVPGSAPFKRQFYDAYASRLARRGYVVLVADKRGAGESGGMFESENNGSRENLGLLAKDVVAGVEILAQQSSVDPQRIGLFGLSQAGWVSALAASETPIIRFLVMVTAPTVSVGEEGTWSDLRGDDESDPLVGFANANEVIMATEPYGFDPRDTLAELAIPSLWLFGDSDNSIPSGKSMAVLDSMPNSSAEYRLYAGYGHLLIGKGNGRIFDIAPASWPDIYAWLDKTVGESD